MLVTSPPEYRETLRRQHYTVSDLTGRDAKAAAGTGRPGPEARGARFVAGQRRPRHHPQPDNGILSIVQTGAVHTQIDAFCEKLRIARGRPTRSRLDPELFALTTRSSRAMKAPGT